MNRIEINSFLDFQFPSAPAFSPDGKTIAFVLQQPSLEKNKYTGNLWLMDVESRSMVLPGKSGVDVPGTVRGTEPELPRSLPQVDGDRTAARTVTYSCLDRNGHMNNTRYLDWVDDLAGSEFHRKNRLTGFTVCYLSEAREGDRLAVSWTLSDGVLQADVRRENTDEHPGKHRIFGARMIYSEEIM